MVHVARSLSLAVSSFLAFCVGCAASPPTGDAIHFDPCQPLVLVADASASEAQTAGIQAGLALWNQAARTRLSLSVGASPAQANAVPVRFQAAAAPSHGFYDPALAMVLINTDLDNRERAIAIAHEIGHAFALIHIPGGQRSSVMNAGNLEIAPTGDDVEALAALWGACPVTDESVHAGP
jgi:hypothetical protein